jgi:DNA-binding FrmR family transcriptional regulator
MAKHQQTKRIVARLARVEGHIGAVKRMVEENRPCTDVLVQIAAVRSALDRAAKLLLTDHMEHCVLDSVRRGSARKHMANLREALERFVS